MTERPASDTGSVTAGTVTITGGDVVADSLRAAGARIVFNVSSTGQSSFYDSLATRPELKLVAATDEGLAAGMAHGYELAGGGPGILMLPGIGMANAASNLYNAWKDRSAVLALSDAPRSAHQDRDAFQGMNDNAPISAGFTKTRHVAERPEHIAVLVRRALKEACTPERAPVHVQLPVDVLAADAGDAKDHARERFRIPVPVAPPGDLVEQAARMLVDARTPMINAGQEVSRAGAAADLVELAQMLGIRVSQGLSVFCDFPCRHPLFAGRYALGYPLYALDVDTFLNVGAPMPGHGIKTIPLPDGARVIDVHCEPGRATAARATDVAITADVRETIRALIDAVSTRTTVQGRRRVADDRLEKATAAAAAAAERRRREAARAWSASPICTARLYFELDRLLEDDACVVVETGDRTPHDWLDFGPGAKTLIGPTTGFALGWGVSAALGARLAQPQRQVVALVGDGAMLFGQLEALWTASRYDIPLTILVFNNRGYDTARGRIHFASRVPRRDPAAWRDMSCYLGDPDVRYADIARAFDVDGAAIATPDEIEPALRRAFAANREGRPFLVDAAIAQRGAGAGANWRPRQDIPGTGRA